jgi:hypothetical protein
MYNFELYLGIILAIIGIILAFILPYMLERWKKPKLQIFIDEYNRVNQYSNIRYLHGRVINRPHSFLSWIERYPAYDTKVKVGFYDSSNQLLFEPIETKWSSTPECKTLTTQIIIHKDDNTVEIKNIENFDSTKTIFAHNKTIYPDTKGELFVISIKNKGNENCFAFNGWSYRFNDYADPELRIPIGEFEIDVEAIATNSKSEKYTFILRNNGSNISDIEIKNK